jgi:hypothetical protein
MKLIAANISNLTDARFFAVYRPDLLVIPLKDSRDIGLRLVWFRQVHPWIEGPSWAVSTGQDFSTEDLQQLLNAGIDIIVFHGDPHQLAPVEGFQYIFQGTVDQINKLGTDLTKFFAVIVTDAALNIDSLADLPIERYASVDNLDDFSALTASPGKISGLVVLGSDEEKVGVKSFEDLHDLLENLYG